MGYLKINGDDTKYNVSIIPFTTQHGNKAIGFKGDAIPQTDQGFKYYNDDDTVASDLSEYKYYYQDNQYSVVEETIEYGGGNFEPLPPSQFDRLNSRISKLNGQVTDITPYTETKTAYIDDTKVVFKSVRDGNISIYMIDKEGRNVPFTFDKFMGDVRVYFEKRTSLATVTISIQ